MKTISKATKSLENLLRIKPLRTSPKHKYQEPRGTILVWVMVAIFILLTTIFAGLAALVDTSNFLESQALYYEQATSIAKAGLIDGLSWFRRQTAQPVITFNPQRDMLAMPPINDTDDATIGIVRELEVEGSRHIYGRYEVRKTDVMDVSSQRGLAGTGTVWKIESIGYLFLNLDPTKAYNVWPNKVLTWMRFGTEIRRVSMVLPGPAALCTAVPNQTTVGNNVKVIGGSGYGIIYPPFVGTPTINAGATVTGTPTATSQLSPFYNTCDQVFGISESELRSVADYYVTAESQLPDPIPNYKIVFFDGNAAFNNTHPLVGTGIFYITGTLTLAANGNAAYNGLIYCKGQYHQLAPSMINGSVITLGQVQIESTGDVSEIDYDAGVLQQTQTYTGQYRFWKGFYQIE